MKTSIAIRPSREEQAFQPGVAEEDAADDHRDKPAGQEHERNVELLEAVPPLGLLVEVVEPLALADDLGDHHAQPLGFGLGRTGGDHRGRFELDAHLGLDALALRKIESAIDADDRAGLDGRSARGAAAGVHGFGGDRATGSTGAEAAIFFSDSGSSRSYAAISSSSGKSSPSSASLGRSSVALPAEPRGMRTNAPQRHLSFRPARLGFHLNGFPQAGQAMVGIGGSGAGIVLRINRQHYSSILKRTLSKKNPAISGRNVVIR